MFRCAGPRTNLAALGQLLNPAQIPIRRDGGTRPRGTRELVLPCRAHEHSLRSSSAGLACASRVVEKPW
jgi:hypothetical protein